MRKHYPLNSNGAEDAGKLPWIDGVPSTGVEGSYPGQALFTDTEAEILAAIDASGQTRNGSDLTQLIQAIGRGIYVGQFGGTPNALTCALPNNVVFASLVRGIRFGGFVTATNTTVSGSAGVTVALAGIGPLTAPATVTAPLLRKNGTALQVGDLPVNQDFDIRWDGSAFRMAGAVASDGGGGSVSLIQQQLQQSVTIWDRKAYGTPGGTFASGAWRTRDLNYCAADLGGLFSSGAITLAGNTITLPSGKYRVRWQCPAESVDTHISRLQDVTNNLTLVEGTCENGTGPATSGPQTADQVDTHSMGEGGFTLAAATQIQLQHRCASTSDSSPPGVGNCGFGCASSYLIGGNARAYEWYSSITIDKVG